MQMGRAVRNTTVSRQIGCVAKAQPPSCSRTGGLSVPNTQGRAFRDWGRVNFTLPSRRCATPFGLAPNP